MTDADGPLPNGQNRWTASTQFLDMWVDPADDPRDIDSQLTNEREVLIDYLRNYRLTMSMKCADLDAEQLARRSVPPSTMSLLGLLRHMANVERYWFRQVMAGQTKDLVYDRDDAWHDATADPDMVEHARRSLKAEIEFAETFVADASDLSISGTMRDGDSLQLREVLVHMIEEYARHCGHADLLRECLDGRVGQ